MRAQGPGLSWLHRWRRFLRRFRDGDFETTLPIFDLPARNKFLVTKIYDGHESPIFRIEQLAKVNDVAVVTDQVAFGNPKLAAHLDEKGKDR
jgi:hypothetical protein